MTSSPSPIEELHAVIRSKNPFDKELVVRKQDVWGKGFPDVPSLNAHASDAVFDAILQVRTGKRQTVGITITAEKGLGKSHLISRIRHRLQADGSALFVYMSECGDLNRIKIEFLRTLASSLKQKGSQGVTQWRELATALVNEAFNISYTAEQMVNWFSAALARSSRLVERLTDKVLHVKPDIENPNIITAILWTLSSDPGYERFAINWLCGTSLPHFRADAMGLSNPSTEDKEAESFNTVRQIVDLISDYKPIVVCFDELDVPECSDAGFTKAQVTAGLAKDLYNSLKKGVLLTVMYPETWGHQIKRLPSAEAVTLRIGDKKIDLKHLNADNVITLVSQWLKDFYEKNELTPPHPVYPFEEGKLRELARERPLARTILKWCAENFKVPTDAPTPTLVLMPETKHPVESAYNNELAALESTVEDYMENKVRLADALRLGLSTLIGETIEQVFIEDIVEVRVRAADRGYFDFKIIGKENGKIVKIGVAILQEAGGMIVQATLKRLIDYRKFDFSRGCLVRSKQINSSAAKAQQYLQKLLSPELGGEWVLLKSQDIKPLLAMMSVLKASDDYEFKKEQIIDFIKQKRLASENYLIREILSAPSGRIPEDAIDEDGENDKVNLQDEADMVGVGVEALFN